jgi:hypothetical protein
VGVDVWQRKEVEQDVKALGRNLILMLGGLHQGRILILTPGVLRDKHRELRGF